MAALLIDASPYIFRAYFSLPESIKDSAGQPANAVYGFTHFLNQVLAAEAPSHLLVAFDRSLTTSFRNEIYPPYKAQRELPPAELENQLSACEQVAAALGAAVAVDDRYEADDLIAAMVEQVLAAGERATVVTGDKDLAQLVGPAVDLLDFARGERWGVDEVVAKFGVPPEQIADLLALAGDPVDNIPGVAGVGRKTAAVLLGAFGSVEALYERLAEVPALPLRGAAGVAERLAQGREAALLSKRLAIAAREAPCPQFAAIEYHGADPALVGPLFERLGFGRIRDRISRWRS